MLMPGLPPRNGLALRLPKAYGAKMPAPPTRCGEVNMAAVAAAATAAACELSARAPAVGVGAMPLPASFVLAASAEAAPPTWRALAVVCLRRFCAALSAKRTCSGVEVPGRI